MSERIKYLLLALIFSNFLSAQKPPLDHSVYDGWKSINSPMVSDDGKWVSYIISPQEGDGLLYLFNVSSGKLDSVPRGSKLTFSPGTKYAAFQVSPAFRENREAKKKKLKEEKMPKNNLGIKLLASGETISIPKVKSFALAEENSEWMAYQLEKAEQKKDTTSVSDSTKVKASVSQARKTANPEGSELVIFNPLTKKEYRFSDITEYTVAEGGKTISFIKAVPDTLKSSQVTIEVFSTSDETVKSNFDKKGIAKKIATDKNGDLVSFLFTSDTSKNKVFDLYLSAKNGEATKIADNLSKSLPVRWTVSENSQLTFSDDATRLYFGTARKPEKEKSDTLLDDEKYRLDIWSWNDDILQPMQKKQLDQELKRTYLAVYHIDKKIMFQLADSVLPAVQKTKKGNADLVLASSDLKYRKSLSWDDEGYEDYYLVNAETGNRKMMIENTPSSVYLSPSGNYLFYYNYDLKSWISLSTSDGEKKNISIKIRFPLFDELNDLPSEPQPYGMAGWMDDNRHVLVYDRFDIWSLDLSGIEEPVNMTNGFGRNSSLRLRYVKTDPDAEFIRKKDKLYLSAFNYQTKESGIFLLNQGKTSDPEKLVMEKAFFSRPVIKAKNADVIIYQKESFNISPELFITNMRFTDPRKISVTNPQQKNYNWVTAELVEWNSFDNSRLQGILYKPEDFDPARKYPMIVYFYERSSDGLFSYIPPAPSASIINRTFAASNGYLVFVPDIPYKVGYPGQSCYDAVISGTNSLLDRFSYIDRSRLALDGQSWGGYQIAWLVTRTDMFACAYSGAPVSDMISAYGGIRWESGMSRMFQYEKTQSRIGGTLWEKPLNFIENSPVFFVPKINTPLLIMSNDADGAVPWYQGIEFINALRRLDKPAWLLSYNDEAHNLVKRPNKKDISIRKMQFFDHYLKGAPMPYWMMYGIHQTEKGKIDGYNLINN